MQYQIRPLRPTDEPSLWEMLFYAAQLDADGATDLLAAVQYPRLRKYVGNWDRLGDLGFVAVDGASKSMIGAIWARIFVGGEQTDGYVDDHMPEVSIAVRPAYQGQGIGTQLFQQFLAVARERYPAIVLDVRASNPAKRLYERMGFVVIGEITNRVGGSSYNMLLRFG